MTAPKTPLRSELLIEILGIVVLLAFVGSHLNLLKDPGVGWHLRTGQWIAEHLTVPVLDPFLFTSAGKIWICNQWLADLFFWGLFRLGGTASLQVAVFLICLLPYLWIAPHWLRAERASAPALCLGLLISMGLGVVQWYTRPVIFSFLLFALTYKLLVDRCRANFHLGRSLVVFGAIFALWANLHPGFPLGLALIGIAALDVAIQDGIFHDRVFKFAALLLISVLATLINPFGFELHANIMGLVGSKYFMGLNQEWQSPNFHNPVFWPFLLTVFLILTAPTPKTPLLPLQRITLALFVLLGLSGARYVPFLGIAAAAPLVSVLQSHFGRLEKWSSFSAISAFTESAHQSRLRLGLITSIVGAALLLLTIFTGRIPGWSDDELSLETKFPKSIVETLKAAPAGTKVFHTPNFGGYFTWTIWPHLSAFIDDRNELNGKEIYEDFFEIARGRPGWQKIMDRYAFDYAIIEKENSVFAQISSDANWLKTAEDDKVVLYRKTRIEETRPTQ